ncbi:hypothetical protein B566_EDAN016109 [Ephemera danica]|nr:hypothetical protein B566_EDAN016109 [Ephemera danica]
MAHSISWWTHKVTGNIALNHKMELYLDSRKEARAFLQPASERKNLHVIKGAHVTRIVFEGKVARAVQYKRGETLHTVRANKEIIVSAGVIGSPQILMLSGVGPREHLENLGISVVHELPGVGENLQDHVSLFSQTVSITPQPKLLHPIDTAYQYFQHRTGPLASFGVTVGGFIRTPLAEDQPDIQMIYFGPMK